MTADAQHPGGAARPGGMADGGVVVLVAVAGVQVRPLLAMPPILGDVGMLVPVHLGVVAVGVSHGEPPPAWPCLPARTPPRLPVRHPRG
jgi:hypothetical protein